MVLVMVLLMSMMVVFLMLGEIVNCTSLWGSGVKNNDDAVDDHDEDDDGDEYGDDGDDDVEDHDDDDDGGAVDEDSDDDEVTSGVKRGWVEKKKSWHCRRLGYGDKSQRWEEL